MIANELMIGDWVYTDQYNKYWQIKPSDMRRIWGESESDMFDEEGEFKHIIPIPITDEILKANDLKVGVQYILEKDEVFHNDTLFRIDKVNVQLISSLLDKDTYIVYIRHHETHIDNGIVVHFKFHYVHELQHALRLCGLTDLADNFKLQ